MDRVRARWRLLAALCVAAASLVASDPAAAEEALDAFPDQAAAVVRIASFDKFAGGFKELAANLGPLGLIAGPGLENGLNQAFQGAADGQAIDRAAAAYLAIFPLENQRDPVAWLVRAADETKSAPRRAEGRR